MFIFYRILILFMKKKRISNDDYSFEKETDRAYKNIKNGKRIKMDFDEFIDNIKKW